MMKLSGRHSRERGTKLYLKETNTVPENSADNIKRPLHWDEQHALTSVVNKKIQLNLF